MTTFTVWKSEDEDGAARPESALSSAASDGLVKVVDHAVLTWPDGTEDADMDRLGERFRGRDATLISTDLTEAERSTLLETFGGA